MFYLEVMGLGEEMADTTAPANPGTVHARKPVGSVPAGSNSERKTG